MESQISRIRTFACLNHPLRVLRTSRITHSPPTTTTNPPPPPQSSGSASHCRIMPDSTIWSVFWLNTFLFCFFPLTNELIHFRDGQTHVKHICKWSLGFIKTILVCLIKWDVADLFGWNKVMAFKWRELLQIFACSAVVSALLWRSPIAYIKLETDTSLKRRNATSYMTCYICLFWCFRPTSKCQYVLVAPQNALLNISAPRTAAAGCLPAPRPGQLHHKLSFGCSAPKRPIRPLLCWSAADSCSRKESQAILIFISTRTLYLQLIR